MTEPRTSLLVEEVDYCLKKGSRIMLGSGTVTGSHHLCLQRICYLVRERERKVNFCNNSFSSFNKNIENKYYYYMLVLIYSSVVNIVE